MNALATLWIPSNDYSDRLDALDCMARGRRDLANEIYEYLRWVENEMARHGSATTSQAVLLQYTVKYT